MRLFVLSSAALPRLTALNSMLHAVGLTPPPQSPINSIYVPPSVNRHFFITVYYRQNVIGIPYFLPPRQARGGGEGARQFLQVPHPQPTTAGSSDESVPRLLRPSTEMLGRNKGVLAAHSPSPSFSASSSPRAVRGKPDRKLAQLGTRLGYRSRVNDYRI